MKQIDLKLKYFSIFLLFIFTILSANASGESSVINGLSEVGLQFYEIMNSANVIYGIYFLSTFFVIFTVLNTVLQKTKNNFQGKPAKVISTIISIMVVGAIFYKKEVETVVTNYNTVGYGVFVLFFVIAAIGYGGYLFNKFKKEKKNTLAVFLLSFFVWIGTSMLKGILVTDGQNTAMGEPIVVSGGIFEILFGESVSFLTTLTDTVGVVALAAGIVTGVMLLFEMFGDKENGIIANKDNKKKKPDDLEKKEKEVHKLLDQSMKTLNEINDVFAKKVDTVNNLRTNLAKHSALAQRSSNNEEGEK